MMFASFRQSRFSAILAVLALLAGALVMRPYGNLQEPGMVLPYLSGAGILFLGFALGMWRAPLPVWAILGAALLSRMILLGQYPGDDIYRYIWEGRLLLLHINPYLHAPDAAELLPLRDALWQLVGHKPFSAIYPPLAQWAFALMAGLSPSLLFFKTIFAAADLWGGFLLARRFGWQAALLALWNPLTLTAFAGAGHYDSLFVLALILAWLAWDKGRSRPALLWLGAAVALKWLALPILGWAIWQRLRCQGLRAGLSAAALGAIPLVLCWLALSLWTREWTLQLSPGQFAEFARSAEFVPRLVGLLWEESLYINSWVLLPLALAWGLVILRAKSFVGAAEGSLFFALILSPLVHIWYFTWLVPFAVASRNRGTLLLSASGFIYFALYHRLDVAPDAAWRLSIPETLLLWLPFVLGFLWTSLPANRRILPSTQNL